MHRPTEPESALRSPAGRYSCCNVHFGRRATNEITLPMEVWALCWHSHPRECLDLWWNWLAERGQRQSAAGVLGSDGKGSGITILQGRHNQKISVKSTTDADKHTIQQPFNDRHISPQAGSVGKRILIAVPRECWFQMGSKAVSTFLLGRQNP